MPECTCSHPFRSARPYTWYQQQWGGIQGEMPCEEHKSSPWDAIFKQQKEIEWCTVVGVKVQAEGKEALCSKSEHRSMNVPL